MGNICLLNVDTHAENGVAQQISEFDAISGLCIDENTCSQEYLKDRFFAACCYCQDMGRHAHTTVVD